MRVHRLVLVAGAAAALLVGGCGIGGGEDRKVGQVGSAGRAPSGAYNVGDIVRLNDLEVVVYGVKDPFDAGAKKPAAGSRYVSVDAEVRNRGKGPEIVSGFAQFELKDPEGESFGAVALPGTPALGGEAAPGGTRRGEVSFEVPQTSQGLQVLFSNLEYGTSVSIYLASPTD